MVSYGSGKEGEVKCCTTCGKPLKEGCDCIGAEAQRERSDPNADVFPPATPEEGDLPEGSSPEEK